MAENVVSENKAVNDNNEDGVYTQRYDPARDRHAPVSPRQPPRGSARAGRVRRHFADKQALLDALSESGFVKLGAALSDAIAGAGADFDSRMSALAQAYVRFATEHAALLELMFASKHRPGADRLHEASAQAFAPALGLIAEGQAAGAVVPGDLERVAMVAFAGMHGIAALANSGLLGDSPLDELVDDAVERLALGLRPR
jgi:AcrR family transcriptional regulator